MTHGLREGRHENCQGRDLRASGRRGELLCSHAQTKIGAINCSGGEGERERLPGGPRNKREVPFIRMKHRGAASRFGDSCGRAETE